MPDWVTLMGGSAVLGMLMSCWSYVRMYTSKLYDLFFVTIMSSDEHFVIATHIWAVNRLQNWHRTRRMFKTQCEYIRPRDKNGLVAFELLSDNAVFVWYKRWWLVISGQGHSITFLRGTCTAEELIADILDNYNNLLNAHVDAAIRTNTRFSMVRRSGSLRGNPGYTKYDENVPPSQRPSSSSPVSVTDNNLLNTGLRGAYLPLIQWQRSDLVYTGSYDAVPFSSLSLDSRAHELVLKLIRWKASQKWYAKRSIPWRQGVLLYGKPGTGKSTFVRNLGVALDMPIYMFDLASMCNTDFIAAWEESLRSAPAIILLEDFDNVFHGRKNQSKLDGALTFDCVLNCISGIHNSDGALLIVTTNDISKIDPAMGQQAADDDMPSRPGRIDHILELASPDRVGLEKMAKRILEGFEDYIPEMVEAGMDAGDTGAQFQKRCSDLALKLYWSQHDNTKYYSNYITQEEHARVESGV